MQSVVLRAADLERRVFESVPTGIAPLDALTGGLPRGAITEIFGPPSSGRTSAMVSILAEATAQDEVCALVDGNDAPALPCRCDTLIDGDAKSVSIAAASIIAKVTRDRMMRALHEEFPGYGWFNNKGYATEQHLFALNQIGPCRHHRRSFAPVYHILRVVNHEDSILTA